MNRGYKAYKGIIKEGHRGSGKYIDKAHYVIAKSLLEAMTRLQLKAGVKHEKLPFDVREIDMFKLPNNFRKNYGNRRRIKCRR